MTKALPKDLTSYDFLKTLAVLLMIADHIGVYFFPDELWWRAAGRLTAPIWLFLIGYARTRDIPVKLWGGALLLTAGHILIAPTFFPLTILLGMIIVRLVLDKACDYFFSEPERLLAGFAILVFLMVPSHFFIEYGALCLLVAMFGYVMRWNEERRLMPKLGGIAFAIFTLMAYGYMNLWNLDFNERQIEFVMAGCVAVFAMLYFFKPVTFPKLTKILPWPVTALIQFGGRRTLEIYIAHLLLFKALAFYLGMEGFGLFEWRWY